jgi:UDP-N-acetylglucosamine/UDP-N-acetylgalactosamine diphosphorylase
MTSNTNHTATKKFFEENNFFGYSSEHIQFFIQNKLPIVDTDGKIILSEPYLIKEASNGNRRCI